MFETGKNGNILTNSKSNVEKVMGELGLSVRENEWTSVWKTECEIKGDTSRWLQPITLTEWTPLITAHYEPIKMEVWRRYRLELSLKKIKDWFFWERNKNKYHPIKEVIEKEEWDGIPRLETWLMDYAHVEDNVINREVSAAFIKRMVSLIYRLGDMGEMMLVLMGDEGTRKSELLRALTTGEDGQNYYSNKVKTKYPNRTSQTVQATRGVWVVEMPEMKGVSYRDGFDAFYFIKNRYNECRVGNRRERGTYPIQYIITGTTKERELEVDINNSRLYWLIKIPKKIDIEGFLKTKHQLFAEALAKPDLPNCLSEEVELAMRERVEEATTLKCVNLAIPHALHPESVKVMREVMEANI